jgi:FMN phosphatase YigB (HAD superfamily)
MAAVTDRTAAWLIDLDGTLYRPVPVKIAMACELLLCGRRALPIVRAFRRAHEEVRGDGGHSKDPYLRQIACAATSCGADAGAVGALVDEWLIRRAAKWIAVFRRRRLIRRVRHFKAAGGRVAIVSDYPALKKLAALACLDIADAVVASGEADSPSQLKPNPEGYLKAAALLGVAPGECLIIGDRKDTDGAAASRAGMRFEQV